MYWQWNRKIVLDDLVRLSSHMVIAYTDEKTSLNLLIDHVFPNLDTFATNPDTMIHRSILTPKNDHVDNINTLLTINFLE